MNAVSELILWLPQHASLPQRNVMRRENNDVVLVSQMLKLAGDECAKE
jgi:hypothetical protein